MKKLIVPLLSLIFMLGSLTSMGCSNGGGGDSSNTNQARVYVSPPAADGMVLISGTQNVTSGEGTVTAQVVSPVNTDQNGKALSLADCASNSASSNFDGSFFALSVCAQAGDSLSISFASADGGEEVDLGSFKVPPTHKEVCPANERYFKISNNSTEHIWLGVTAGTLSCKKDSDCPTSTSYCIGANPAAGVAGTCSCAKNSDCGSISTCNLNNQFCYWNLPQGGVGQHFIPSGKDAQLCFPAAEEGKSIQWSGNMFARTGCDENGQKCSTADCGSNSKGQCPVGTGGTPPNTLVEFTLSNQNETPISPDFYDVSIINGINLAASMAPIDGSFKATSDDPYSCGGAGLETQSGKLSGCNWQVNPIVEGIDRTELLRNVKVVSYQVAGVCPDGSTPNSLGSCECTSDSACSKDNLVCGLALNAKQNQQYTQVCGQQIGWWTADQICGSSINNKAPFVPFGEPLNCATKVENSDKSYSSYTNFHICSKPADSKSPLQSQSCYNNAAIEDCCGCGTSSHSDLSSDWPAVFSPGFPGSDNGCYSNNKNWNKIAQPWLVFLKKACPTAYTYAYDDATSTFTCQGEHGGDGGGGGAGPPSYEVVFFNTK